MIRQKKTLNWIHWNLFEEWQLFSIEKSWLWPSLFPNRWMKKGEKQVKRWFFSLRRQKRSSIQMYAYIHIYLYVKIKPNLLNFPPTRREGKLHHIYCGALETGYLLKIMKLKHIYWIRFICPILKRDLCCPNLTFLGKRTQYFFKLIKQDHIF